MKRLLVIALFPALLFTSPSYGKSLQDKIYDKKHDTISLKTDNFTDVIQNQQDYNTLVQLIEKYDKLSNDHNLTELKKLYSTDYVNADGFNYETLFKLLDETWKNFPDIKFITKVESIHINNNYATVQTFDVAKGTTSQTSEITKDIGELVSNSRMDIYFQKYGSTWKIVSDKIQYEKTFLKYGKAKSLKMNFSAPEQVASGTDYTATIQTELPVGSVALGSITHEPIVYPQAKPEEVFRQIAPDSCILERVMKSNTTNNNELTVASIGYTELMQDMQNPKIKLSGMAVIMQRVNVIPKTTYKNTTESTTIQK